MERFRLPLRRLCTAAASSAWRRAAASSCPAIVAAPQHATCQTWGPAACATTRRADRKLHTASIEEVESGERYKNTVKVGRHVFMGDLTHPDGSPAEAPEPKELALAAVGLCTSMTLRLYADRKEWPLTHVRVEVKECSHRTPGHISEGLVLELHLEGQLSEEQKSRLLQIADKCPVKQMMLGKMPKGISTVLA